MRELTAPPPQLADMVVDRLPVDEAGHRHEDVLGFLALEGMAGQTGRTHRLLAALHRQVVDLHRLATTPPQLENTLVDPPAKDVLGALCLEDVAGQCPARIGEELDLAEVVVQKVVPMRRVTTTPPQLRNARRRQLPGVEHVLGTFGRRVVDDMAGRTPQCLRRSRAVLRQVVKVPPHRDPPHRSFIDSPGRTVHSAQHTRRHGTYCGPRRCDEEGPHGVLNTFALLDTWPSPAWIGLSPQMIRRPRRRDDAQEPPRPRPRGRVSTTTLVD